MHELPEPADSAATPQAAVAVAKDTTPDPVPWRLGLRPTLLTRIILAAAILVLAVPACAQAVAGHAVPSMIILVIILILASGLRPQVWLKDSTLCRLRSKGRSYTIQRWDLWDVYVSLNGSMLSFMDAGNGQRVLTIRVSHSRKKLLALATMIEAGGDKDRGAVQTAADLRALAASRHSNLDAVHKERSVRSAISD